MKSPSELFSLNGKIAVVIGGTGELCGAMAEGIAKAGATVAIVGRDAAKAKTRLDNISKDGGKAEFFSCDTTSKAGLEKLLADVIAKFGKVDILVNGAGVNSATPFFEISEDEFAKIITVNLKGVILACQIFGRHMVDRGSGSIINVGSASGLNPLSRVFTYSASKAAVHNLSKNLAREWAAKGVRVNILVPGFFPAEQNRKVLSPDRVKTILAKTPMNRFGEAHELIGATLLLASDAGSFITGTEMVVDGGFDAMTI
ncbi:MAG TPA: SDR family oxidoreductase [Candidatus Acidoferrales bacterium]|jgi:NAD(P)-dependent dehydrogenase (short-subunit alcohol dehydrogenase family)|nr:SDR family oxidoreductase [Candidatus Acidoferrales bacterium]